MTRIDSQGGIMGAVVLAAGSGVRFKSDKRLARMPDGQTLLETTLSLYVAAFQDVLLVLADADTELGESLHTELGAPAGLSILYAPEASEGMGGSLRASANHIQALPEAWLMTFIALGDMPYIRPQTLKSLLAEAKALGDAVTTSILTPFNSGQQGHPVGIGRNFLPDLANCGDDRGARDLLESEVAGVRHITLSDPGILADIDRPEDLV